LFHICLPIGIAASAAARSASAFAVSFLGHPANRGHCKKLEEQELFDESTQ